MRSFRIDSLQFLGSRPQKAVWINQRSYIKTAKCTAVFRTLHAVWGRNSLAVLRITTTGSFKAGSGAAVLFVASHPRQPDLTEQ